MEISRNHSAIKRKLKPKLKEAKFSLLIEVIYKIILTNNSLFIKFGHDFINLKISDEMR